MKQSVFVHVSSCHGPVFRPLYTVHSAGLVQDGPSVSAVFSFAPPELALLVYTLLSSASRRKHATLVFGFQGGIFVVAVVVAGVVVVVTDIIGVSHMRSSPLDKRSDATTKVHERVIFLFGE